MQRQQQRWLRLPAPTLGEHNRSILKNILGFTDAMIDQLEQDEVIGQRPKGL
jgi:crotonobetainyl-CoA:carnitine CoA-transferase CaiB-like acyl-CoA transferase